MACTANSNALSLCEMSSPDNAYLYTCLSTSPYTCPMPTCLYTCLCICLSTVSAHVCTYAYPHVCTHAYTHIHTNVYTHVYTHVVFACLSSCPYTFIQHIYSRCQRGYRTIHGTRCHFISKVALAIGDHYYLGHDNTGHDCIGHTYTGHDCIGHTYTGHDYIGHTYTGHDCIGHNYTGHNYTGHDCIGHNYTGHDHIGHNLFRVALAIGSITVFGAPRFFNLPFPSHHLSSVLFVYSNPMSSLLFRIEYCLRSCSLSISVSASASALSVSPARNRAFQKHIIITIITVARQKPSLPKTAKHSCTALAADAKTTRGN